MSEISSRHPKYQDGKIKPIWLKKTGVGSNLEKGKLFMHAKALFMSEPDSGLSLVLE